MVLNFSLNVDQKASFPVVRVMGEVDVHTCQQLNSALTSIIGQGYSTIILNFENVSYIDSTGLGTVAHAARELSSSSGTIRLVCTRPQIIKIFEVSGLNRKNIQLFDSEETALQ